MYVRRFMYDVVYDVHAGLRQGVPHGAEPALEELWLSINHMYFCGLRESSAHVAEYCASQTVYDHRRPPRRSAWMRPAALCLRLCQPASTIVPLSTSEPGSLPANFPPGTSCLPSTSRTNSR